ncbi:hypothetical protein M3221_12915 [Domibacillus indicus]|uniref:hypothetical protein n=1 Tax=Domibacillus indicus TaxID=1437523 RepID=UPI00203B8C47|nr:hypothetical protein [Domibacillus indicus]MCM3789302.1 hypothetical protein [Domibacillus indicus]
MKLLEHIVDRSLHRLVDEEKNLISLPFDKSGTILDQNKPQETWVDLVSVDMTHWRATAKD